MGIATNQRNAESLKQRGPHRFLHVHPFTAHPPQVHPRVFFSLFPWCYRGTNAGNRALVSKCLKHLRHYQFQEAFVCFKASSASKWRQRKHMSSPMLHPRPVLGTPSSDRCHGTWRRTIHMDRQRVFVDESNLLGDMDHGDTALDHLLLNQVRVVLGQCSSLLAWS